MKRFLAAWGPVALGGAVLLSMTAMLTRLLRPVREIRQYVKDIRTFTEGAVHNMEPLAELRTMRDLSASMGGLASAYVGRQGSS